jgi:hypothetical protein
MKSWFVRVEAQPGPRLRFEGTETPIGFFQRLGVTANDEQDLIDVVRDFLLEDGESTLVELDDLSVPDFEGSERDIQDECGDMRQRGVWYASGRAFFGNEGNEE